MVAVLANATWTEEAREALVQAAIWGAVLLGLILVLVLAVCYYRTRYRAEDRDVGPDFTLQDLRELRERGELSASEFDRLKSGLLGKHRGSGADAAGAGRANSEQSE